MPTWFHSLYVYAVKFNTQHPRRTKCQPRLFDFVNAITTCTQARVIQRKFMARVSKTDALGLESVIKLQKYYDKIHYNMKFFSHSRWGWHKWLFDGTTHNFFNAIDTHFFQWRTCANEVKITSGFNGEIMRKVMRDESKGWSSGEKRKLNCFWGCLERLIFRKYLKFKNSIQSPFLASPKLISQ